MKKSKSRKKKMYGKKNKSLRSRIIQISHTEGIDAAKKAAKNSIFLKRSTGY